MDEAGFELSLEGFGGLPGKRPGGGQKGLYSQGKRGQAGRAAPVPFTQGPQPWPTAAWTTGWPPLTVRPSGRSGARTRTQQRYNWKTGRRCLPCSFLEMRTLAGALGSGSTPKLGLSLSGCYGDAITSPPPGSLGEGGRDHGHQEKPRLQSLKQRNPRCWIAASGTGAVSERLRPGEKSRWLHQPPASETHQKRCYPHGVFFTVYTASPQRGSHFTLKPREEGEIEITLPLNIGEN